MRGLLKYDAFQNSRLSFVLILRGKNSGSKTSLQTVGPGYAVQIAASRMYDHWDTGIAP